MTDIKASEEQDESAPRLLIIGDDEAVLRLLSIKLPRAGFRVSAIRRNEAGISTSSAEKPDAVVLASQSATREDTRSLIEQISESWGEESPPIVLLSTSHELSAIREALRRGCDDYVVMPFSPSELAHRLRVVITRNRLHKIEPHAQSEVPGP